MLPPVIAAMLAPGFFPHPADDIHLLQTHASFVVLAGDYVYKIKKPVDFGFLNYTTLDLRKHFIGEELRISRRFAPEVYLGVFGIRTTPAGYALGERIDAPDVIEVCLQMKRFDQAGLLNRRLEAGDVGLDEIEALAVHVAAIHRDAPMHPEVDGQARVRKVVEGNYEAARAFLDDLFPRAAFESVRGATDRFFAERGRIFDDRAKAGWFRECHGDMHAGNVATIHGALAPFDAIEFSDTYRIIDVLADVAFLAMDLEAFGRVDLANRFLNVYLEQMGAWDGAEVLAVYLGYRAFVRAKINALTSADPNVQGADRERCRTWASRYFALAARYADRLARGEGRSLTIMHGHSGSGKSTVARKLAAESGALHIRSDAVRKHLAGRPLVGRDETNKSGDVYSADMTARTYERMLELAETGLRAGFPVILDARYPLRRQRDAARALAGRLGVPFHIAVCESSREELTQRLQARTGDISDAGAELIDRQLAEVEPVGADER